MNSSYAKYADGERPKSIRERCAQAEEEYQKLFTNYRTHNFLNWGNLSAAQGKHFATTVPPYCFRFDEFLGYWLSNCLTQEVPDIMEKYSPTFDKTDCSYLENVLDELGKIEAIPQGEYKAWKGSELYIGPGVCPHYTQNVACALRWVQEQKEARALEILLWSKATLRQPSFFKPPKHIAPLSKAVSLSSFFQNGFTIKELDDLLIKLVIINESRKPTDESKPRKWVSIIKALLDEKLLIPSSNRALHSSLIQEYKYHSSLPKLRTLQEGYNADNAQARDCYQRALAFLKSR